MDLVGFVTYFGLLITAYSATQEYNRLKLKLSNKLWKYTFIFSLFLIFLSTFEWLKIELTQRAYIQTIFNDFFWQSKYQIILALNLFSLYKMYTSTRLRTNNAKEFYDLLFELKTSKQELMFNKLVNENLENIFKYKNHQNIFCKIRLYLYYKIDSYPSYHNRVEKDLKELSRKQEAYLKNGGDFNQLNNIGKLPNVKYTSLEKFRNKLATIVKPSYENHFSKIYDISFLDKKVVKLYKEYNELFGLEILSKIAKYNYFSESLIYIENYLMLNLLDKNSLFFKNLYHDKNSPQIKFIYDNQSYENGFDFGYIICVAIAKLINKNEKLLRKNIYDYNNNKHIKQINHLYEILGRLNDNKTHLIGEPLYIQRDLAKYIDFNKSKEEQNIAYSIMINQINRVQELASSSSEANNLKLFESLIVNIFSIDKIRDDILLDVALSYSSYIFEDTKSKNIEKKVEKFKSFIKYNKNKPRFTNIYLQVFDKYRGANGTGYTSYTKSDQELENYWDDIYGFLKNSQNMSL